MSKHCEIYVVFFIEQYTLDFKQTLSTKAHYLLGLATTRHDRAKGVAVSRMRLLTL